MDDDPTNERKTYAGTNLLVTCFGEQYPFIRPILSKTNSVFGSIGLRKGYYSPEHVNNKSVPA